MRPIVLTGMMGAGKTVVAAELGYVLGRRVVDLDAEIERDFGITTAEIFARFGEQEFRARELATFRKLAADGALDIVSLGGGAFVGEPFRCAVRDAGALSIYLHAPVSELAERLAEQREGRPLLHDSDWRARVSELYRDRDAAYREADMTLETSGRSIKELAAEIADVVR